MATAQDSSSQGKDAAGPEQWRRRCYVTLNHRARVGMLVATFSLIASTPLKLRTRFLQIRSSQQESTSFLREGERGSDEECVF